MEKSTYKSENPPSPSAFFNLNAEDAISPETLSCVTFRDSGVFLFKNLFFALKNVSNLKEEKGYVKKKNGVGKSNSVKLAGFAPGAKRTSKIDKMNHEAPSRDEGANCLIRWAIKCCAFIRQMK
ncbi:hypothetical protein CEXT_171581 [Caerostris extrusa]|uniref:Uncharacterized protein n=1 Tax=Caerostris extrusa TaxID=172846 RepID=A0AAV4S5R9_CAEEX|nr:hypothetical protein CEXT_171581 [Caerostris extrusa]